QDQYAAALHFDQLDRRDPSDNFNLHTDPACRAAMEIARDTGLPATSTKVMLAPANGENPQAGFLIYAPIYENDRTPKTVDERRLALTGFVYSQFRASDFLTAVLAIKKTADIDIRLYDGPDRTTVNLLHDTATDNGGSKNDQPRFTGLTEVEVAGRRWTVAFASRPE